jgi:hypothetical protein
MHGAGGRAAFVQGLGPLNWKEGGNLRIDWRWGGSDSALFERRGDHRCHAAEEGKTGVYSCDRRRA